MNYASVSPKLDDDDDDNNNNNNNNNELALQFMMNFSFLIMYTVDRTN
jgi:hypothetical protein